MNEELKEWLGIKPADFLVYGAIAAVVGMYLARNVVVDVILALVALGLHVLSCSWGMKSDPRLSKFSNAVKLAAYPLCLVTTLVLIVVNFVSWNR